MVFLTLLTLFTVNACATLATLEALLTVLAVDALAAGWLVIDGGLQLEGLGVDLGRLPIDFGHDFLNLLFRL